MASFLVRLDDSLWKQFRLRADTEGRRYSWILRQLITRYIKEGI
jgi:predicted transcriptional regulator